MKHLVTPRTTTALAPWLALLLLGGGPPQAEDVVANRKYHEQAPHVAMFGPPPTGRPAISAREINRQLLNGPILPGPHANTQVVLPVDAVAQKARTEEETPSGEDVPTSGNSQPPSANPSTVAAPVEDAWGQIVTSKLPEKEDYAWEDSARENFSDYDSFLTIDRPLERSWESNVEQPAAQAPKTSELFWRQRGPSPPEVQEVAPWLKSQTPIPGPHECSRHPYQPTPNPVLAFPAEPRVAELDVEYREPPTVPLPAMEVDLPLVDQPAPQVTQLPESRPTPESAWNEDHRREASAPIQEDSAFPVGPLESGLPRQRSLELEIVARNADIHTQSGFELAGKLAYFSARTEFIKSLRMLSEALDTEGGTHVHGDALAAGLLALEESDEFVPRGANLEADIDVAILVDGHNTPVLKDGEDASISPLEARQRYYTYAQQQLATSIENEVAGSMALYGMGKLYTALSEVRGATPPAAESKAVVFHQAALMAVPQNAMAANEMGVLLAKLGRLEPAREMLRHSLRVAPLPATWHNLSVVHARLGERELAQLAHDEHVNAVLIAKSRQANSSAPGPTMNSPVQWVAPEELARTSTHENLALVPQDRRSTQSPTPALPTTADVVDEPQSEAESNWWSKLPLINRNKSQQH